MRDAPPDPETADAGPFPDPFREILPVSLRSLRGANLWSTCPVTRLDVAVGAYDEISSAEVPGVTEALVRALPGLEEHRCSIGERGGFITRLRRGTYAPHIMEHLGLELQTAIGHDVGFGRARGGDRPGEYTVVFEHQHAGVGLRAAALALELVQRAFAGTLEGAAAALSELRAIAASPDAPPLRRRVLCGITGGGGRAAARAEMLRRGGLPEEQIVAVAPSDILREGLPYASSRVGVILDRDPGDAPPRYHEPGLAVRLLTVVAEGVPRDGLVVVPSGDVELQEMVLDAGCRLAVFTTGERVTAHDARVAHAVATVRDGRIVLERGGDTMDGGMLRGNVPLGPQAAAALALLALEETKPAPAVKHGEGD